MKKVIFTQSVMMEMCMQVMCMTLCTHFPDVTP